LGIADPNDYLGLATGQVHAAYALRDDLLAVLFPRGGTVPSELLQTRVKLKLLALVDGIERDLLGAESGSTRSWDMLSQAGLLREKALVHFALARIAEDRLRHNMYVAGEATALAQLPTALLNHENARLSDMARKLLAAEQLGDDKLYLRLESERLHQLCWRIVAALQEGGVSDHQQLTVAANALLADHDGDNNPAAVSRKLVFFLGAEHRDALAEPRKAGISLFVAAMSDEYGLESDLLFRLIGEASTAPLLIMLKGKDVAVEQLPGILAVLRGPKNGDASPELGNIYAQLDPIEARATIAAWDDADEKFV
jgi:hypothetical protein